MPPEASAPVTATPAPAAGGSPPAPASPPPTETTPAQKPAEKPASGAGLTQQQREKTTNAQRIAEAAKLLQNSGSAKESTAPAEGKEPTPDETPADAAAKGERREDEPHEPTNAEWKELRNRKTKLEKREQALASKEQEYASRDLRYQQWEQRISAFNQQVQLLKSNPRAFLDFVIKESGSDYVKFYEELANGYIDQGRPDAKLDATRKELEQMRAQIERDKQEAARQQLAARDRQIESVFLGMAATEAYPSTQVTLKRHGVQPVMQDAMAVRQLLIRDLRREPTDVEVAKELDAQYEKHYRELVAGHPRLAAPQGVAQQQGAVEPVNAVAPKAPTTLTNGAAAVRTTSGRKLTPAERIAAAAELLPDPPRPRGI